MRLNNVTSVINNLAAESSKLTRGELRIANHINTELGDGKKILLSKKTLNLINNYSVLNNSQRGSYDTSYFGALGRRLIEVFIRKHLIFEYPNKNTFFLNLYDKALRSLYSSTLQKSFNFSELVRITPQNGFDRENLANRFYTIFSMIYSSSSIEKVEKILSPLIKKGIKSDNIDFLLNLLHGFYKDKLNKKFVLNVIPENDGRFTAICKVGEDIIDKAKSDTNLKARQELLKKILAEVNLYSVRNNTQINNKVFNVEEISPLVDNLLVDIGFLTKENARLLENKKAKDMVFRAFNPEVRVNNAITFQKLEFYGDAVCNMLIERFLLEKNLPISEKIKYYAGMKSNETFSRFFDKLELETYLYYRNIEETPKIKADTFEALIGALHLSFPEKKVYEFLKPLYESRYIELKKGINI